MNKIDTNKISNELRENIRTAFMEILEVPEQEIIIWQSGIAVEIEADTHNFFILDLESIVKLIEPLNYKLDSFSIMPIRGHGAKVTIYLIPIK